MRLITIILMFLFFVKVGGQELPGTDELNRKLDNEVSSFILSNYIQTPFDFEQEGMSSDEVDNAIRDIIISQKDKSIEGLDFPINNDKLNYLGFIHPTETNIFFSDYNYFLNNDVSIKGDSTHIYKYENLYVCTKGNTVLDRYLIYYAIRAHLIIKYRFPKIYHNLFLQTSIIPHEFVRENAGVGFVNLTKNYFITFDGQNTRPENNAYLGTAYKLPEYSFEIYPNTQVIYLNKNTIKNGGTIEGGVKLYPNIEGGASSFHRYMRDGFIHTFVHEKIHDWIFQYKHLNNLAKFLREESQSSGLVTNYYPFEEAVVNNTTNLLFESEVNNGGLSDDILNYYRRDLEVSINKFKAVGSYENMIEALKIFEIVNSDFQSSNTYKNSKDSRLFLIDFSSVENQPTKK
ncbi:hypothetical protein [Maribacter sp. 2308TA10-17]|uniref:hypothetical protein n=1 Tax=Maribacter sp. 2308TA10-17 TaxID=3386276 RepID=UPI0039BCE6E5